MPEQENKCRQSHGKEFIEIFELASLADHSYIDV
jgi:hypothetical protein